MKARFEQIRNDLFWRYWDNEERKTIKWSGYNDSFWWDNVSKTDQFQVRGKYRLDPITDEVTVEGEEA